MSKFFKTLWKIISVLFGSNLTGSIEKGYNDASRDFRRR